MVIAEMRKLLRPTFAKVMTCTGLMVPTVWLAKFTLPGDKLAIVPVPVRATVCGLPLALSATVMVPLTVPFVVGVKLTEIVQLAPLGRLARQVWV